MYTYMCVCVYSESISPPVDSLKLISFSVLFLTFTLDGSESARDVVNPSIRCGLVLCGSSSDLPKEMLLLLGPRGDSSSSL